MLPLRISNLWGLDIRLTEAPDVLSPLNWVYHTPPELHELRPGQTIIIFPAISDRLAYGQRNPQGRWTPFRAEDREYHVTVTLRGLDASDPPYLPCYASAAIRGECWQGEVTSGAIAARLDSAQQRERAKRREITGGR